MSATATNNTSPPSAINMRELPLSSDLPPLTTTPREFVISDQHPPCTPPRRLSSTSRVLRVTTGPVNDEGKNSKSLRGIQLPDKQKMHMLALQTGEEDRLGGFSTPLFAATSSGRASALSLKKGATATSPAVVAVSEQSQPAVAAVSCTHHHHGHHHRPRACLDDLIHNAPRFPEILSEDRVDNAAPLPSFSSSLPLVGRPRLTMKPTMTRREGSASGPSPSSGSNKRLLPQPAAAQDETETNKKIPALKKKAAAAATKSVRMPLPLKMPLTSGVFLPESNELAQEPTSSRRRRCLKKRPAATTTDPYHYPLTPPRAQLTVKG